jgi:hypothetical protein
MTALRTIGAETIIYLCKKTNIKANKTNAQRMPPSPSNMAENRDIRFETPRNNCHKSRNNQSKEKRLFQNDGFLELINIEDDWGYRQVI